MVVGVGGAWRSKSASVGRRAARLAGASAGLAMFFISTIAVVAIDGGQRDPGAGVAGGVSESFSNVSMLFLIFLPLATTAVGWVAATAFARLRFVDPAQRSHDSMSMPKTAGQVTEGSKSRSTGHLLLLLAVVVVVATAAALFFEAR